MKNQIWIFLRALQRHPRHLLDYSKWTSLFLDLDPLPAAIEDVLKLADFNGIEIGEGFQSELDCLMMEERRKLEALPEQVQLSHLLSPNYPRNFRKMTSPPWTFQYIGSSHWNSGAVLGVVGSREPTFLTVKWMEFDFSEFLKDAPPIWILSGGARGVDQLAHKVSLRYQIPTAAWIPSGLGDIYPESFGLLVEKILLCGGSVLSEFDYHTKMRKHHFYERNRLIAGMSDFVLVPQGSQKSGTMITAHKALEWGRPVMTLPGHPLERSYWGNLDLLQYGADLVRSSRDLQQFMDLPPSKPLDPIHYI